MAIKLKLKVKKLPPLKPAKEEKKKVVVKITPKKKVEPVHEQPKRPRVYIVADNVNMTGKELADLVEKKETKLTKKEVKDVVKLETKLEQLVETIKAEPSPLKWSIPSGVIVSAAIAYFVREWKANNPDAKRLLALQAEAYGVNVPMHTDNELLDSLQQEVFSIITKGRKLSKQHESLKKLISWTGFAGGHTTA